MLTKRQRELLLFLHKRIQRDGISPSFDEMRAALLLRSKSGVHRLLSSLQERGFIKRLPQRARAIEILRMVPLNEAEGGKGQEQSFPVARREDNRQNHDAAASAHEGFLIPFYGRIAAGFAITAVVDETEHIHVECFDGAGRCSRPLCFRSQWRFDD